MSKIVMSNGQEVEVDQEDYYWLSKYTWRLDKDGYAVTYIYIGGGKQRNTKMHRLIMEKNGYLIDGRLVDHIDRNTLNNRKSNLRLVSHAQNSWNRVTTKRKGKYIGVTPRRTGNFEARIEIDGVRYTLGTFSNEIAGACCYNHYVKLFRGEYAVTNDVENIDYEKYRVGKPIGRLKIMEVLSLVEN